MKSVPIVHIYYGSEVNKQFAAVLSIISKLKDRWGSILFVSKNSDAIKSWTEDELVSWLLDCDMHLILCHPHQGMRPSRSTILLYSQMQRLRYHIGFPNGDSLRCPIWSQNKIEYLHAIPHITNPTLRIWLDPERRFEEQMIFVDRYVVIAGHHTHITDE
jgi:hypothetical protein